MSKIRTKEELVRLSWLTELRRQGHRQCRYATYGPGNQVCPVALLAEINGLSASPRTWGFEDVGYLAGLSYCQISGIICLNDDDHLTFSQIADVVASWFPGK